MLQGPGLPAALDSRPPLGMGTEGSAAVQNAQVRISQVLLEPCGCNQVFRMDERHRCSFSTYRLPSHPFQWGDRFHRAALEGLEAGPLEVGHRQQCGLHDVVRDSQQVGDLFLAYQVSGGP